MQHLLSRVESGGRSSNDDWLMVEKNLGGRLVAAAMDEECRSENSYEPSIAEDDEWQEVAPIGLDTGFSFDGIAGESLFGVASFEEGTECSLEHVHEVTGNQVSIATESQPVVSTSEPTPITGSAWDTMLAQAFSGNMGDWYYERYFQQ